MKKWLHRMALIMCCAAMLCVTFSGLTASAATVKYGLTLDNGVVKLNGKPYYAMGVNFYDAFLVNLRASEKDIKELDAEFKQLKDSGIPLARISMCGYSDKEFSDYIDYPEFYYSCLDKTIALAEKYQIGIVFDLCWAIDAIPGYCYGYRSDMGDAGGEVIKTAKAYVKDIVTRYKDSPAVWMWEIGNEYNLDCDLKRVTDQTESQWVSVDDVEVYYRELATVIRSIDPYRLITGGDSEPRNAAYHLWKDGNWTPDSYNEMATVMKKLSPEPMNVMSVHVYQDEQGGLGEISMDMVENFDDCVGRYVQAARSAGQALFVGEFGIMDKLCTDRSVAKEILTRQYKAFMKHGVQLSCIWVYAKGTIDDDPMTISPTNDLAYQYNMVVNGNKTYRSNGKQDSASYWANVKNLVYTGEGKTTTASKTKSSGSGDKTSATKEGTDATTAESTESKTTVTKEDTDATGVESTEPTETEKTTDTTEEKDNKPVSDDKRGETSLWWIWVVVAGVVLIGGGVAAWILIAKKKENK